MSQIGALSLLPFASSQVVNAAEAPVEEKNHFVAGPYLQNMGSNEVTIMWITHKNCFSWVEYGAGTYTSKRVDRGKQPH